jgi:HKD family nuclease
MEITFTDNLTKKFVDELKPFLSKAHGIKFAIAFVKHSGFSLISSEIKECLHNGGGVEFLVGLDFKTTEPQVLREFIISGKAKKTLPTFA